MKYLPYNLFPSLPSKFNLSDGESAGKSGGKAPPKKDKVGGGGGHC